MLLSFSIVSLKDNAKVNDSFGNASENIHFNIYLTLYRLYRPFAMINIKKIQDKIDELRLSKVQLIKNSGLTRVTIDKILKGGEVNVSTLEALAKGLGVSVGFFFDDVEEINGSAISGDGGASATSYGHASVGQNQEEHDELIRMREENKYLKQLLADKDERIDELKERIDELKGRK